MVYRVTFDGVDANEKPIPVALGQAMPGSNFTVDEALQHAVQILADGKTQVTIQDGNGRSISGADLLACINGKKTLTEDLQAI